MFTDITEQLKSLQDGQAEWQLHKKLPFQEEYKCTHCGNLQTMNVFGYPLLPKVCPTCKYKMKGRYRYGHN